MRRYKTWLHIIFILGFFSAVFVLVLIKIYRSPNATYDVAKKDFIAGVRDLHCDTEHLLCKILPTQIEEISFPSFSRDPDATRLINPSLAAVTQYHFVGAVRRTNDYKCAGDRRARHFFSSIEFFEIRKRFSSWETLMLKSCTNQASFCTELETFNRSGYEDPKVFLWQGVPYVFGGILNQVGNRCRTSQALIAMHSCNAVQLVYDGNPVRNGKKLDSLLDSWECV